MAADLMNENLLLGMNDKKPGVVIDHPSKQI